MQSFQGQPINDAPMNVIINSQPRTGVSQEYAVKGVKILSSLQIIFGSLAIIFQIWNIYNRSRLNFVGTGIWAGVLFIVAGSLGVHSSKTKRICVITAFLVMSIIASLSAAVLLPLSAIDVANYQYTRIWYDVSNIDMVLAVSIILLIISLAAGVVAIVSSAYACHGLCIGNVLIHSQVEFLDGLNGQTQMVLIPMLNEPNVMSTSSPYQLTSSVGGFQNQPLPSAQGEIPTVQAEAPPQAPTYLGQADPPADNVQNDQQPLHKSYA